VLFRSADFYTDTIKRLIDRQVLRPEMKVLAVCAGEWDRSVLAECGFTNVTLTNLDERMTGSEFAPFAWRRENAEQLSFGDGEFDVAMVHSGLHHCRSPHRALLEMYRVSRLGLVVFEPSDNLATRLGVRLGLGQEYEWAAVAGHDCRFGGQDNTAIPNYVYRWTRREVEKTILSYAPLGKHRFLYFYKLRIPWYRSKMMAGRLLDAVYLALAPLAHGVTRVFPSLSNNFAFVVLKPRQPDDLHPWLALDHGRVEINKAWIAQRYRGPQGRTDLQPRS
jgi:ubiquinone/menaquinone biosynthesis C-methylase UbiE